MAMDGDESFNSRTEAFVSEYGCGGILAASYEPTAGTRILGKLDMLRGHGSVYMLS